MLKLHGMARSNYYSLARASLLEKGMAFEEVAAAPSREADYLEKSPMGKVPCLETEQGFISETFAIVDYLDHLHPDRPLLPTSPFERAKAIELIRHLELDVELVARRCLPAAFFGADLSEETKAQTAADLKRGVAAVDRLLVCDPYALGAHFTLADLYVYFTFGLASAVIEKIFERNLQDDIPRVKPLMAAIAERDSIRTDASAGS